MKKPSILTAKDFEVHFKDAFWRFAAETICRRHDLSFRELKRSDHGENIIFLIDDAFIVKIYTPFRDGFKREKAALHFASGKTSLPLPKILFEGGIEGFDYLVTTQLGGRLMTRADWLKLKTTEQVGIVSNLAAGLKELHSHNVDGAGAIDFDWQSFIEHQTETVLKRQKMNGANPEWLARLPGYLEENLPLLETDLPPVFLHGDVHFGNLRLTKTNGNWKISGLFDLADSLKGSREYEFVAIGVLMIQGQSEIQREFFRAYGYEENELDEALRRRLMLLTILYECSDLRKYALRLKPEAVDLTLDELERAIWNFC
jgi:hygromycin-B 7''-O-kinase